MTGSLQHAQNPTPESDLREGIDTVLLLAGEKMNEEVFERFVEGTMDREHLEKAYVILSEWRRASARFLDLMTGK